MWALSFFLQISLVAQLVKSACNAGDPGSILEDPLEKDMHGNPLQYSCLENPMDRGAWWATVHGVTRVGHDWSTRPTYHMEHTGGRDLNTGSAAVAHGLGCPRACGILPDQRSNPCRLHWQVDSYHSTTREVRGYFLVSNSFVVLCCLRRCLSRCRHYSKGSQVPTHLRRAWEGGISI